MIRKRQPERVDRMSLGIYERTYMVYLWTQMTRKKNIQKGRKERWEGGRTKTLRYALFGEWRRPQGRGEGQTNK